MIIITRTQPGLISQNVYPDDQWVSANQCEQTQRKYPGVITVEFKLGFPETYSLYEGAGCVLPGHKPEDVFPVWSTTPFERSIDIELE